MYKAPTIDNLFRIIRKAKANDTNTELRRIEKETDELKSIPVNVRQYIIKLNDILYRLHRLGYYE